MSHSKYSDPRSRRCVTSGEARSMPNTTVSSVTSPTGSSTSHSTKNISLLPFGYCFMRANASPVCPILYTRDLVNTCSRSHAMYIPRIIDRFARVHCLYATHPAYPLYQTYHASSRGARASPRSAMHRCIDPSISTRSIPSRLFSPRGLCPIGIDASGMSMKVGRAGPGRWSPCPVVCEGSAGPPMHRCIDASMHRCIGEVGEGRS